MSDLNKLDIKQAHQGLLSKRFSATELVTDCISQIKKNAAVLNTFVTICEKEALNCC
jgi:Asp-tRNA(Asn)/Glu-tRNA(Gln) amidotransferase A subunit family amidase